MLNEIIIKTTEPAASQPKPHLFYKLMIVLVMLIYFTRSAVQCSGSFIAKSEVRLMAVNKKQQHYAATSVHIMHNI